ncbi:MAG: alcohol dehydrogenase catalytic domain-containing protein, partial [Fimbriimonadales bacterium]|nr:alcohol dehydrogenase catalytic domain-containing protein [Fimbriimonadales bacterium]
MRMRAMVLERVGEPLVLRELPVPKPNANQVLIRVRACGVCRTDLHVVDGELPRPKLPLILGHEIVGEVVQLGAAVQGLQVGQRVGVPWLGHTCGACRFCEAGRENLCEFAQFTGYTLDGGYAEYTVADARYVFPLPDAYDDVAVAPLLCAGLIGYRSYRIARQGMLGNRLGIYGFGAAAHILIQIARREGMRVFAFTRPGDFATQDYARNLGAWWAGGSDQMPPEPLDGAILFAPVGALVP